MPGPRLSVGILAARRRWADVGVVAPASAKAGSAVEATVTVRNTGQRAGKETVQLYVAPRAPAVERPVKELKGLAKVFLQPGETTTVGFDLTPETLAFHDIAMREVVEPGEFTVMVGTSSRDQDLQAVTLTVVR